MALAVGAGGLSPFKVDASFDSGHSVLLGRCCARLPGACARPRPRQRPWGREVSARWTWGVRANKFAADVLWGTRRCFV